MHVWSKTHGPRLFLHAPWSSVSGRVGHTLDCHTLRAEICPTCSPDAAGKLALRFSRLATGLTFRIAVQRCEWSPLLVDLGHRNSHWTDVHTGLVAACLGWSVELASERFGSGDVDLDRLFHHNLLCHAAQALHEGSTTETRGRKYPCWPQSGRIECYDESQVARDRRTRFTA